MNHQHVSDHGTDIDYPYVIFRLKNELFSVSGKYVSFIQQFPDNIIHIPHAPSYVRGTFSHQGQTVSIVDLRLLFGWQSIEEEYDAFSEMIEHRKNDHINWVKTLQECLQEGKEFPLATNPHQCALGKWRDAFQTDSSIITHQLQKIDGPHEAIHHTAIKAMECAQGHEKEENHVCQDRILGNLTENLMPEILALLDETKDIFRKVEYREMVLVLGGEQPVGLLVDEVVAVDDLQYEKASKLSESTRAKGIVLAVQRYDKTKELVLELDVPGIKAKVDLEH